jgi:hypothetical protein
MGDRLRIVLAILVILAFMGFGAWMWVENWTECRSSHSWLYCVHVLSK